jgi:hypothetical protein
MSMDAHALRAPWVDGGARSAVTTTGTADGSSPPTLVAVPGFDGPSQGPSRQSFCSGWISKYLTQS